MSQPSSNNFHTLQEILKDFELALSLSSKLSSEEITQLQQEFQRLLAKAEQ
jgi:hypothetical protein